MAALFPVSICRCLLQPRCGKKKKVVSESKIQKVQGKYCYQV